MTRAENLCFLELDTPDRQGRVPVSSIISIEDKGAFRLIYADGGSFRDRRNLHEIKKQLPESFLLSDLHHITNMSRIIKPADGAFLMDSGVSVPIEPFLEEHTRLQFFRWVARRNWESERGI